MFSIEDLLETKLTLKAEKEYLQKLTTKLKETMLENQFHVVFPKKEGIALFWLLDTKTINAELSAKKSCLVQRRLGVTYDLDTLAHVFTWLTENVTILRRIVDSIDANCKVNLLHIDKPEAYVPGYITVTNKETHQNVSYYVKDNNIVSISSNFKVSKPDVDTILQITNTLLQA